MCVCVCTYPQEALMGVPRSVGDFFTWGPVVTTDSFYRYVSAFALLVNWTIVLIYSSGKFYVSKLVILLHYDYLQTMKNSQNETNDLIMNVTQPMDFLAGKLEKVRTSSTECVKMDAVDLCGSDMDCAENRRNANSMAVVARYMLLGHIGSNIWLSCGYEIDELPSLLVELDWIGIY